MFLFQIYGCMYNNRLAKITDYFLPKRNSRIIETKNGLCIEFEVHLVFDFTVSDNVFDLF